MTSEKKPTWMSKSVDQQAYLDEISLIDLLLVVWRNRVVALLAALAVISASFVYLISVRPVYQSSIYFLPPLQQDIVHLNIASKYNLLGYSVDDVYTEFIKQLNSLTLRWRYFKEKDLLNIFGGEGGGQEGATFSSYFDKELSLKSDSVFQILSFSNTDQQKVAQLLNEFAYMVIDATKEQLIGDVNASISAEVNQLETQLASKRNMVKQRRKDKIAELTEALEIAKKLKIKKPADFVRGYSVTTQLDPVSAGAVEKPLYYRGALALEAEIEILKHRESDDPFIDGLRDIQERLNALRELKIDPNAIKIVTIDQVALVPEQSVRPRKSLILSVGVFMAFVVGVIVVFVAELWRGMRRQLASARDQ